MPKPFIVHETLPPEPIIARGLPEAFDHVPADPDYFIVTFLRGAFQRYTQRNISTIEEARAYADAFNIRYWQCGKRALIYAIKGTRSYGTH